MYYLYKYKGIKPSYYFNAGFGEKQILKAFIKQEIEEKNKILKNKESGIFPVIGI